MKKKEEFKGKLKIFSKLQNSIVINHQPSKFLSTFYQNHQLIQSSQKFQPSQKKPISKNQKKKNFSQIKINLKQNNSKIKSK